MSIGALSGVSSQISTMSALLTAMQPSVQSWSRSTRRVLQRVRQAVDHDAAAGFASDCAGRAPDRVVRVGHLDREEVVAARIAARQIVGAFGRAEVPRALLLADGVQSERDL